MVLQTGFHSVRVSGKMRPLVETAVAAAAPVAAATAVAVAVAAAAAVVAVIRPLNLTVEHNPRRHHRRCEHLRLRGWLLLPTLSSSAEQMARGVTLLRLQS